MDTNITTTTENMEFVCNDCNFNTFDSVLLVESLLAIDRMLIYISSENILSKI